MSPYHINFIKKRLLGWNYFGMDNVNIRGYYVDEGLRVHVHAPIIPIYNEEYIFDALELLYITA